MLRDVHIDFMSYYVETFSHCYLTFPYDETKSANSFIMDPILYVRGITSTFIPNFSKFLDVEGPTETTSIL